MLPITLTVADALLYIATASYVHTLSLPWGPTNPPLGCTPSILVNTSNDGDAHNA